MKLKFDVEMEIDQYPSYSEDGLLLDDIDVHCVRCDKIIYCGNPLYTITEIKDRCIEFVCPECMIHVQVVK